MLSHVQLFATPWTVAHQSALSTEFSRQEYWSGLPFPSPGALPNPRIEPRSPALWVNSLPAESEGKPKKTGVGSCLSLLQQDLPNPGTEPGSPALQADALPTELPGKPVESAVAPNLLAGFKSRQSWLCHLQSVSFGAKCLISLICHQNITLSDCRKN